MRLASTPVSWISCLLLLIVGAARPTNAAAQEEAHRELWKSAFVDAVREDRDLLQKALENAVSPNRDWVRSIGRIRTERARPYYPVLSLYETYHDFLRNPRSWDEEGERVTRFVDAPAVVDDLAQRAYLLLREDPATQSLANREWRKTLDRAIRRGKLPSLDEPVTRLAAFLPRTPVAGPLLAQLAASEVSNGAVVRADLSHRVGDAGAAVDRVLTEVAAQQEKIDVRSASLPAMAEGKPRDDSAKERDRWLLASRNDVHRAATVLKLLDPELGRVVKDVGDAALDGSKAIRDLMAAGNLFSQASLLATGDLIGAGFKIAQAFMDKKPDIGTLRHQQIMKMLAQISRQLREIQVAVNRIDRNVTELLARVEEIRDYQAASTHALLREMNAMEARLTGAFTTIRDTQQDLVRREHQARVAECDRLFPTQQPAPATRAGRARLTSCLSDFISYGLIHGKGRVFVHENHPWTVQSLPSIDIRSAVHFVGMIPVMVQELRTASGAEFPDVSGAAFGRASHPLAVADAVRPLIALRLRHPRHPMPTEKTDLLALRAQLASYRDWSDAALQRSTQSDGGGLLAFEQAKARVQEQVRQIEQEYLALADSAGAGSPLAWFCAMELRTDDVAAVRACRRNLPSLTDTLRGRTPLQIARYAVYHGKYNAAHYDFDWGPKTGGISMSGRACGHDGDYTCYTAYVVGNYTAYRFPTFSRQTPNGLELLVRFEPFSRSGGINNGPHESRNDGGRGARRAAENARLTQLGGWAAALRPAPHTWRPLPDQGGIANPDSLRERTDRILRPLRMSFARWLSEQLNLGRLNGLQAALDRLDRVAFAWMAYERLALGDCSDAAGNYAFLRARGKVETAELRGRLQAGDLVGFVAATDPLSDDVRRELPLAREILPDLGCSRIPREVEAAINGIDRYLDLRAAAN